MNYADEAIHAAITAGKTLRKRIKKKKTPQVKGADRDLIRATALAWFNNSRKSLMTIFNDSELSGIDDLYQRVLLASHKASSRAKYVSWLKTICDQLAEFRVEHVVRLSAAPPVPLVDPAASDTPPDFTPLVQTPEMKAILDKRWAECNACIAADAPLAAIVMVGGFLEGLLLGRVHRETNKAPIMTAAAAPRDAVGKTKVWNEWTLHNYINVAHELRWITVTTKDVGDVLKDYRNYIHPYRELSKQISLTTPDAALLWVIGKQIARQIVASVQTKK